MKLINKTEISCDGAELSPQECLLLIDALFHYRKHLQDISGNLNDARIASPKALDEDISLTYMTIQTIEVGGFMPMFLALRLPFGKAPRVKGASDFFMEGETVNYGGLVTPHPKDIALLQTLIKNGDEHAKVMRGVVVWVKITAPVFFWCEAECYRAGHERLCSESTMHIDCKGLQGVDEDRYVLVPVPS